MVKKPVSRKPMRLKGYDYSHPGAYFVILMTHDKACLFGEIGDCQMHLNPAGKMVEKWWHELPDKFPSIALGDHVIITDHFHAIITIESWDYPVGVDPDQKWDIPNFC